MSSSVLTFRRLCGAEAWGLILTLPLTQHLPKRIFLRVSICSKYGTMFSKGKNYQKNLSRCEVYASSFSASLCSPEASKQNSQSPTSCLPLWGEAVPLVSSTWTLHPLLLQTMPAVAVWNGPSMPSQLTISDAWDSGCSCYSRAWNPLATTSLEAGGTNPLTQILVGGQGNVPLFKTEKKIT